MQGTRIPVQYDAAGKPIFTTPTAPGEYWGPVRGMTSGDIPAVMFLKPNSRDADAPRRARSVQHICSPPHTFTEEPDGSLTVSPSISDRPSHGGDSDGWHGYLEKGRWRQV